MALSLFFFLSLSLSLLLLQGHSQTPAADPPVPGGPLNITGILDKGGQFSTFIRLLKDTQSAAQIVNQLNNSADGMTVFSPTDNAFAGLKPGALNGLSSADQVRLVQAHILPKYYTLANLLTISNPVRTQATADDGFPFGLNFTGAGTQVNVSTGVVATQVNTALTRNPPLAVYQVDVVLLPEELFGDKPRRHVAPAPAKKAAGGANETAAVANEAPAPVAAAANDVSAAAVSGGGGGLGVIVGLLCMAMF